MIKAILFTNISSQDSDDTDSAGAGLVRVCLLLRAQCGLGGPGLKWTARPGYSYKGDTDTIMEQREDFFACDVLYKTVE